jgi:hypothetical protein
MKIDKREEFRLLIIFSVSFIFFLVALFFYEKSIFIFSVAVFFGLVYFFVLIFEMDGFFQKKIKSN